MYQFFNKPITPMAKGQLQQDLWTIKENWLEDIQSWNTVFEFVPETGLLLEFGVASGGSLEQIAQAMKPRIVYGFDWFHGLPEPWLWPNGEVHCKQTEFTTNGRAPVETEYKKIVKGLVEDTLEPFLREHPEPIAFCHFDLDLYKPTKHCLRCVGPQLMNDAILLFDEIHGPGADLHEEKAFAEFIEYTGYKYEIVCRVGNDKFAFRIKK